MKKGLVRIIIGCILVFFQALSVMGNCAQGQVISISFANTSVFLFDLISLISYFLVGIIGTILLISGLVAYKRTKEDRDDNEESSADRCALKQEVTPQETAKEQDAESVKIKPEDLQKQPVDKNEAEIGLSPENPIYTLASKSVKGEEEYLKRLRTENGEKIMWSRRGSISVDSVRGVTDIYETYLPSGERYKTIYINMYGNKEPATVPAGFVLIPVESEQAKQQSRTEKTVKNRYCSRCGSLIDPISKKCTGCGKQYFKGIRIKKTLLPGAIIFVLLVCVSVFAVNQYMDSNSLKTQINILESENTELRKKYAAADGIIEDLEKKIKTRDTRILSLQREVTNLEAYKNRTQSNERELHFYEQYCAIIVEGSKQYHTYGCEVINGKSFWMYNLTTAKDRGYSACSKCH